MQSPHHCLVNETIAGIALLQQTKLSKQQVPYTALIEESTNTMDISYNKSSYNHHCNDLPIIIDTGASSSSTPHLSDFVSSLEPSSFQEIQGISGPSEVVVLGTIEWIIWDYWNAVCVVRNKPYYVPDIQVRLFSRQSFFQANDDKVSTTICWKSASLELPD
jgi:hypothetical protein